MDVNAMLGVGGGVGYGGCERRKEGIVGGRVRGVRLDVNEELNVLRKFKKPEDQWSCKRLPDILAY